MKKVDIIIPVYNAPDWTKLCIYSLFKNTENDLINNVYLINDCSDLITTNCLNNLSKKYKKIRIIENKENLGFIKSVNLGFSKVKADYVLLLNTDCIITKNTINKLINHIENNDKIGLICPISSNAANLSLDLFEGFTFSQMNNLLEKKFLGKNFDACTVVGNCLLISKKCLDKTGYFDEIYGMGYGDETDYQFKAMSLGFEAKVAIDTYVFHKSEVSFGISKEKKDRLENNRKIFFDRWGNEYYKLMEEYKKNDPIKYIFDNLTEEDKKIKFDFVIYLIGIVSSSGGVHVPVDLINYMAINNVDCNIIYNIKQEFNEIMLFNPIHVNQISKYKINKIVSTLYISTFYAKYLSNKYKIPLLYFSQGYECYFENGLDYGVVELSYRLADEILTISKYLKNTIKERFDVDSKMISNGINLDLLYKENNKKNISSLTFCLRGNNLKGDFIALDILKQCLNKYDNLDINIIYTNKKQSFPFNNTNNKINYYLGPLKRNDIISIMQNTDIYIDTSISEGFGLMPLEAMACGAIPIVGNSGGISEYIIDSKNGYIINEINDINMYMEKIDKLMVNNDLKNSFRKEARKTVIHFDFDDVLLIYKDYFSKKINLSNNKLSKKENELYDKILKTKFKSTTTSKSKKILYRICKMVPLKIRIKIKNIVQKLYQFTNER